MQIVPGETLKYAIWGVAVLIAQIALSPLLEIRGIHPDLLLIYVIVITFKKGKYAGLIIGFIAGFAQDSLSLEFLGVMSLSKSTVAFWAGKWLENREKVVNLSGWFVLLLITAFGQDFISSLFILQGSHIGVFEYVLRNVVPTAVYTTVIGSLWFIAPFGNVRGTAKSQTRLKRFKR
ncbi:rod shape-determining protein MreD [bacterium]|nr:rod shape-determining protein MreD [bacterium]